MKRVQTRSTHMQGTLKHQLGLEDPVVFSLETGQASLRQSSPMLSILHLPEFGNNIHMVLWAGV